MRMSEKCRNNSDNPLTSCRIDGGKNIEIDTALEKYTLQSYQ